MRFRAQKGRAYGDTMDNDVQETAEAETEQRKRHGQTGN